MFTFKPTILPVKESILLETDHTNCSANCQFLRFDPKSAEIMTIVKNLLDIP